MYLQHGSKDSHLCVDIYDEAGVGGGASGIAGGLLHPYSPKGPHLHSLVLGSLLLWHLIDAFRCSMTEIQMLGMLFLTNIVHYTFAVKLLWQGAECWEESLSLLNIAEQALLKQVKQGKGEILEDGESVIVRRRFVLRHV